MRGSPADIPRLLDLTLGQAIELLRGMEGAGVPVSVGRTSDRVLVIIQPPATAGQASAAPPTAAGLERLGETAVKYVRYLRSFHLVCCAYHAGAESLNQAARELQRCKATLPSDVMTHPGDLSDAITDLETDVFAPYFGVPECSFSVRKKSDGKRAVLSPDGERAAAVTRDYLLRLGCLPSWPGPSPNGAG